MVPANGWPGMKPTQEVVVLSAPTGTGAGYFSIFDQSGDSLMAEESIGNNPLLFTLDSTGSYGNTINGGGTSNYFPVNETGSGAIGYNTMVQGSTISGIFSPGSVEYALDVANNAVDIGTASQGYNPGEFSFGTPVSVAATPVSMAGLPYGSAGLQRFFVVSQNIPYGVTCNNSPSSVGTAGEADALEVATNTISARTPVGACPVYALSSADGKRVFVLNRGSDSITVINALSDSLDSCQPFLSASGQTVTCHPSISLAPAAGQAHAGPVYAEYVASTGQLVVANYDGNSVSIIDVSLDMFGNDSPSFGTGFTVPVGRHPSGLTVFPDGTRAYVANQQDSSISIVDLRSHAVVKTFATIGMPRSIASTADSSTNSIFTKVYVASPNTNNLEIVYNSVEGDNGTESNYVSGMILDVRVSSQVGSATGNLNYVSRLPGAGQPCNLPDFSTGTTASIAACQSVQ
ncbi:MAG: YncE family protein [Terracidiphilus sp.]